jgi:hypothetical protein
MGNWIYWTLWLAAAIFITLSPLYALNKSLLHTLCVSLLYLCLSSLGVSRRGVHVLARWCLASSSVSTAVHGLAMANSHGPGCKEVYFSVAVCWLKIICLMWGYALPQTCVYRAVTFQWTAFFIQLFYHVTVDFLHWHRQAPCNFSPTRFL